MDGDDYAMHRALVISYDLYYYISLSFLMILLDMIWVSPIL